MTGERSAACGVEPGAELPPATWESPTARFDASWGRCGALITTHGEVDAADAGGLADYVERCARYCEWLVLDFSGVEFIGTAALAVLDSIKDRCAGTGVNWAVVPNPAVSRVLRFCAPDRALLVGNSLSDALAAVQNTPVLGNIAARAHRAMLAR